MVHFDTIETALQQLQNGGYVILSDNEDRENEGDLVALADHITPETVYEMLHEANGLMCVPITIQRAHELGFTKMVEHSTDPNQTPFMTTADGTFEATGVTTGVSAFDRAATIKRIANPAAKPNDFNHPGHIQPLYALMVVCANASAIRKLQLIWPTWRVPNQQPSSLRCSKPMVTWLAVMIWLRWPSALTFLTLPSLKSLNIWMLTTSRKPATCKLPRFKANPTRY